MNIPGSAADIPHKNKYISGCDLPEDRNVMVVINNEKVYFTASEALKLASQLTIAVEVLIAAKS